MKPTLRSRLPQEKTKRTESSSYSSLSVASVSFCSMLLLLWFVGSVSAVTRYVWQGSPSPSLPYTNWATAAHVIQDAVDATDAGDTVLVTNGVYATGGRAVGTNLLVNRVAIDRAIRVESVNGPKVTIIIGAQALGGGNGDSAIRCVYLTNDAVLSGFTLTNGATRDLEDDWNQRSPGFVDSNGGGGAWCESASSLVTNCLITGNSAHSYGGGAWRGTLNNCTLAGNSAEHGGGAAGWRSNPWGADSVLNNCLIVGNSASASGGGAYANTLNNCVVSGNSTGADGGGHAGRSWNDTAEFYREGTLNNCTVTGNSALGSGGGVSRSALNNCIVYYNKARTTLSANYYGPGVYGPWVYISPIPINYCCTTPLPPDGVGNVDSDPQLASASHLSAESPCTGAGSTGYARGADIDGEVWADPPSIGCDEYWTGSVEGPLIVGVVASVTNTVVGHNVDFQASIEGRAGASAWDSGDGIVVTNQPIASHKWSVADDYEVTLTAYNETYPSGLSATVTVHVATQPVHYVSLESLTPMPPYRSWARAATNINDAIEAAVTPGALVLVTNGVYATGGRAVNGMMTNQVVVDKPVVLQSVNGPEFTIIHGHHSPAMTNGEGAIRCVYLANNAVLSGFTLTNGAAAEGGGVFCESSRAVVTNCILIGNSATLGGGGAFCGTLYDCTLIGNSADRGDSLTMTCGGGACSAYLSGCTLINNSASIHGGGAFISLLRNCTLRGNSAVSSGGGACDSTLTVC